jgi:hypothetical protein
MFWLIRYGIGNQSRDAMAARNAAGARQHKRPYAGYWYLKPEHDYIKHAVSFVQAISELGGEMYSTDDFEENGGKDKAPLDSWMQKYADRRYNLMMNAGLITGVHQVMLYTSKNVCDSYLPAPNGWMRELYEVDIAHWTTAPEPLMPIEFARAGQPWKLWQHAVVDADGYGVESAKIDLQRYNGTRAQFEAEFRVKLPAPPPPSAPEYVRVNIATLNLRVAPNDDAGTAVLGTTTSGKVWRTTGLASQDAKGRGLWYQVSDDTGQTLWLAGWL